jgi:hypothetical protein
MGSIFMHLGGFAVVMRRVFSALKDLLGVFRHNAHQT